MPSRTAATSAPPWKTSPARAELLALYARIDARFAPFSCDASADCCHFAITGREPYVTPVELAEIEHAIALRGGARPARSRSLPIAGDPRCCPLLGADGRCTIYASRPLGCRTFFCDRVQGPGKVPRTEANEVARAIVDLSARTFPRAPPSRLLGRALPTK